MASPTAPCDGDALASASEIVEGFARRVVIDNRADRNGDLQIPAVLALSIAAFTMTSALRAECVIEAELEQRVFVWIRREINIAAAAPVAAAWTAARDELLPTKGNATVTAVPRL